jgi:serine/threonine protein kinase
MAPLKPLHVLKKRYRILSRVGQGGFGTVYQAEDTLLGLLVALKAIRKGDDEILHLRREARHLASLKHAGIPSYIDLFEERGRWYLVMEWVEGAHIQVGQPLSVRQVVWVGIQVCSILYYLHVLCRQPVIHRDIKPANLRVSTSKQLYLVDFGISCHPGVNEAVAGSKGYAAPEQWKHGGQITPKADIYALGMTLRHLLTGQAPREQASTTQKPFSQVMLPQAQQAESTGGHDLVNLLERMTAEAPNDRPDVREVWQELEGLHRMLKEEAHALQ